MIFTIAIPTFNNSTSIEAALNSCINQCFNEDFEVLVVDNNSTDNTEEILLNYASKIRVVRNAETVNMFENHNICLQQAKGDYVIFCHSDDQLLPDALKKYHEIIKKRNYPERYVLWGRSMFRDFNFYWREGGFNLNEVACGIQALDAFSRAGLTPSGTCYSRKAFVEARGFIQTNHVLAPSDSVSMWKLVVSFFEFEMSDRIFFIRYKASIASGASFNSKNRKDSFIDAIQCLKSDISYNEFESIIEFFKQTQNISPLIAMVLIDLGLLGKKDFRRNVFKRLLGSPHLICNKEILRIILP